MTPIGETAVAGHAPRLSEPTQVQIESRQVANRVVVFEGSQLPQAGIAGPGRIGGHPFFQSPLVPHGEEFPFLFGRLVLLGRMGHGAGGEGPRHVAPGLVPLPQFLVEPLLHALLKVQASFPGRIVVTAVAVVLQKGVDVLLELQLGGGSLQLGIGHGRFGGIVRRKFRRFRPGGRPVDPVRQQGDLLGRGPGEALGGHGLGIVRGQAETPDQTASGRISGNHHPAAVATPEGIFEPVQAQTALRTVLAVAALAVTAEDCVDLGVPVPGRRSLPAQHRRSRDAHEQSPQESEDSDAGRATSGNGRHEGLLNPSGWNPGTRWLP